MPSDKKFYITTPIYYVNARPHIGHAYSTIVADVIARRHRLLGEDVYFLTGTDEHGQKIERSAAAAGIPPQEFADQVSETFRSLWKRMGITNDSFIRTTSEKHKQGVQKLFATLQANGYIYLDTYTGQYCVSDEAYVEVGPGEPCPDCGRITETISESNYYFKLSAFQDQLIQKIESNELLIQPDSRRNEILSFVKSGLKDLSVSRTSFKWGIPVPGDEAHVIYVWLDALANYMTAIGYGSEDPEEIAKFEKYWPADLHLVGKEIIRFHSVYWPAFLMAANLPLPKSIVANGWLLFEESKMSKSRGNVVRTETILDAFGTLCPATQPALTRNILSTTEDVLLKGKASAVPQTDGGDAALAAEVPPSSEAAQPPTKAQQDLLAAKPPAPQNVLLTTEDVLLKGTASAVPQTHGADAALAAEVPPSLEAAQPPTKAQQDLFAADILRYFLLREVPFGQDGSFSFDALVQRYNSDLANGYGNLVSRTFGLIQQNFSEGLPMPTKPWLCRDRNVFWEGDGPSEKFEDRSGTNFIASQVIGFGNSCDTLFWPTHRYQILLAECALRVSHIDAYLSFHKPWLLAKAADGESKQKLVEVLYTAAEGIRLLTALLYPILPYATAQVWSQLGLGSIEEAAESGALKDLKWGGLQPGTKLGPLSPIFPRAPKELIQQMADIEAANAAAPPSSPNQSTLIDEAAPTAAEDHASTHPAAAPRTGSLPGENTGTHVAGSAALTTERPGTPPHSEAPASIPFANAAAASATPDTPQIAPLIEIGDFVKIDLRVAKIIVAERIPKADKLLRLEVDLGPNFNPSKRQILSGIAAWYTPEELIGRNIVVIANLAPRKMRGLESHGMLLAASHGENGKPVLATFGEEIALGSRLR